MNLKNKTLILLILVGTFLFTGCATIDGAGEDIETAGEEIQDVANN